MDDLRNQGKKCLQTVLYIEKNINTIEKYIYIKSLEEYKNNNLKNIQEIYNNNIYQIIGEIINKKKINNILTDVKKNKLNWKASFFNKYQIKIDEQDDFIENPFDIEEGVLECRCGSKRVFSYSKQVRSADEPTTTYAQCMACKSKWSYNG